MKIGRSFSFWVLSHTVRYPKPGTYEVRRRFNLGHHYAAYL